MLAKKLLLVMPDYSDFPQLFLKNLEKLGFSAEVMKENPSEFRYKGFEKIINFFRKTFLKDKSYKKKLAAEYKLKEYHRVIGEIEGKLDYILVIRPDAFPVSVIQELKKKTNKLIAYQWDGIKKFPEIKNYFSLFDSFFCFDNEDVDLHLKPITNFYFDFAPPVYKAYNKVKPRLYFVGLFWENRREKIDTFIENVSKLNVELDFFMQFTEKSQIKNPKIKYIKDRISFSDNLKNVENADVLLDFVDPNHNGLSIRFFEALYYKKKVITDNITVKEYDFYNPNNIFVIENNYQDIAAFLEKPYYDIPKEIVDQYGFSNWIKQIIEN